MTAPPFGRGDEAGERSAAEREAARQERERRRRERAGLPVDEDGAPPAAGRDEPMAGSFDPPPARQHAPSPEPAAPEPEPEPTGLEREPEPTGLELEPTGLEREPEPNGLEPEPTGLEREPTAGQNPASSEPESWLDEPAEAHPSPRASSGDPTRRTIRLPRSRVEHEDQHTDAWDAPVGTVRATRAEPYLAQPGATGIPPHRALGVRRSRTRLGRALALGLLGLLLAAVAIFAVLLFEPFHGDASGRAVVVDVPAGASAREIGDLLADSKVVSSGFFFALRARITGERDNLRSGRHRLQEGMTYAAAIDALTTAPKAAATVTLTLPEGPSRRELVARVRAGGIEGDYLAASKRSSALNPRTYGAPRNATLEGFLFPATYELRASRANAAELVKDQLAAFKQNFAQVDLTRAKRGNLTRYDVIVIASMIEREAATARDRRLIAAVIYNRLKQGMALGIDATVRYAVNNWSRPLKQSELASDSPYNTRRFGGLPPGPIGNPGLASLKAAANPANVPYLYYVVKPCGNGAHAFSTTAAEHEADVAAYNQAREENGGKDPSTC